MNVLIVYAHPEPSSFTAALKDAGYQALTEAGHAVEVSDLYAEGFNPVPGRHDFTTKADAECFHYQNEQSYASKHGGFAPDLLREQARVAKADLIVFLFPIWWGGMPAILKGWFDRVLAYGFAYADGKRYETGFFSGRRGLLGICTGGTAERFTRGGSYGDMDQVLHGIRHCMLEYLGLHVEPTFVAYAAPRIGQQAREQLLVAWCERLIGAANNQMSQGGAGMDAAQALALQHVAVADEKEAWATAR